ncbi:MAG: hypothetical protein V4722_25505 [Bacteroidota bacterium]
MKENNLLASVALFSELYNNDKYSSIADIIAEFIKGAVVSENKWNLNSTELTHLLEKVYEFKIPESVVRTTVRNRLKGIVTSAHGHYIFDNKIAADFEKINEGYNSILKIQQNIVEGLVSFIKTKEKDPITESDKNLIIENFNKYLLDNGVSEKYSKLISVFVIKNQSNQVFTDNLNLIREGMILYQGIRYTADINELGKWNTELTIFLSTEHLFNSLGFNGILYQQIFDDFYKLVSEINLANKNKYGEKLIQLKYLEETKDEADSFFQSAELIHKGAYALDPSKPAMKSILEGCRNLSDVRSKKVRFELDLKQKGITLQEFNQSIYNYTEFVVEDENVLSHLKNEATKKGRHFDENLCRQFFRIFTKINYFRGRESKSKFEKIGHIFITGNRFALYLAHQSKVKFLDDDIPFAKDIDYITNKFWFKLKKGFSEKQGLPKSFSVITKAQLVLSSQLNQTIFQEYNKLQRQFKEGVLTKEEAIERSYELREKPSKPEDITVDNIDASLDFLDTESYFEDLSREKEKKENLLRETLFQYEELQKEINRRDEIERENEAAQKSELREIEKQNYVTKKWNSFRSQQIGSLLYFLLVFFLTILPIIIGFILKGNKVLNEWLEHIGNSQIWIWCFLTIVFLVEWFGRAYLFDKEKIKNGWIWFKLIFRPNKRKQLKEAQFADYENEFQEQANK